MSNLAGHNLSQKSDSAVYELEFELRREDILAHLWRRWRFGWIGLLLYAAAMTYMTLIAYSLVKGFNDGKWPSEATPVAVAWLVAAVAGGWVFAKTFRRKAFQRIANDDKRMTEIDRKWALGKRRLVVSEEEISVIGPRGETTRSWSDVSTIGETSSHVSICADVLFLVPRRAFRSDEEFRRFGCDVRRWRNRRGQA